MKRIASLSILLSLPLASMGCITHAVRVEPISLEPVQVTMDVNLHVDDTRADAGTPADATTSPPRPSTSGDEAAPTL